MEEPLIVEERDQVLILTLNREDRRNALSREVLLRFGEAGEKVLSRPDLRAVIVTGRGERAFCAGADLKERSAISDAEVRAQLRAYREHLGWIDPCPVPVIAAINGLALGGGLELSLLCDLRVAAPHAEFACPETGLAIIPAAEGTQRLPRLIGEARAKQMILLGERVPAARALDWGLVHRISQDQVPLLEDTWEWIRPIREGAALAQRAALFAIDATRDQTLSAGSELELGLYETCLTSEDRTEALRAFAEKRSPVFRGR